MKVKRDEMCFSLSHRQSAGQNYKLKIAYKSFENMAKLKYLGITQVKIIFRV